MRVVLSLFMLMLIALVCALPIAGLAHLVGAESEPPPTLIRVVHTNSGCQL